MKIEIEIPNVENLNELLTRLSAEEAEVGRTPLAHAMCEAVATLYAAQAKLASLALLAFPERRVESPITRLMMRGISAETQALMESSRDRDARTPIAIDYAEIERTRLEILGIGNYSDE